MHRRSTSSCRHTQRKIWLQTDFFKTGFQDGMQSAVLTTEIWIVEREKGVKTTMSHFHRLGIRAIKFCFAFSSSSNSARITSKWLAVWQSDPRRLCLQETRYQQTWLPLDIAVLGLKIPTFASCQKIFLPPPNFSHL